MRRLNSVQSETVKQFRSGRRRSSNERHRASPKSRRNLTRCLATACLLPHYSDLVNVKLATSETQTQDNHDDDIEGPEAAASSIGQGELLAHFLHSPPVSRKVA